MIAADKKFWILSEVTLVDLGVIWFLIRCEDEGIELAECTHYVREWMLREERRKRSRGSRRSRMEALTRAIYRLSLGCVRHWLAV